MHQSMSRHIRASKPAQLRVLLGQILFVNVGQCDNQKNPLSAVDDVVTPKIVLLNHSIAEVACSSIA